MAELPQMTFYFSTMLSDTIWLTMGSILSQKSEYLSPTVERLYGVI